MDWWKLFGGTFILIFLAELGDKTQLAAMAKTADSPDNSMAKWIVFLAASLALVLSTFIAVFLGHILQAVVPERYIKIASGLLFLVFGCMVLYEVFRSGEAKPEQPQASAVAPAEPGYAGRLALAGAMEFESFVAARYRSLAEEVSEPRLKKLLLVLAGEEEGHLAGLKGLPPAADAATSERSKNILAAHDIAPNAKDGEIVNELVRHEQATAEFYKSLAERSIIPSVRETFLALAEEELGHAGRLAAIVAEKGEAGKKGDG